MSTLTSQVSAPIIPFGDLTTKYGIESNFSKEEVDKINNTLKEIDFSNHLSHENFSLPGSVYQESIKKLSTYFSHEWESRETVRNVILSHKTIPNFVVKIYQSRTKAGHPMASILRVPMAHLVQETIKNYDLNIEVPIKGLISLPGSQVENPDKYSILQLDENNISEAFLVVARKINIMPNPIETIKGFGADKQERLAYQACMVPEKTGLADYTWGNLTLTVENKLAIVDTEPLWGGLFVDHFGKGYSRCKEFFEDWTLEKSAKYGLEKFSQSSLKRDLTIFHEKAQKFLEEHD